MAFGMFSSHTSPIAVNFGAASAKMLQVATGEKPEMIAAAEIPIPDTLRSDPAKAQAHVAQELPRYLRVGGFKGKRAICSIPSAQSFIQHMQLAPTDGMSRDEQVKLQLQTQMGCSPDRIVVRTFEAPDLVRSGQARGEIICFALAKEAIMKHVDMLRRCKLEVVGAHTEIIAMLRAFDHLHRRENDDQITTLYVDLGWGGTNVGIGHGRDLAFARYIQIGGRHFDQMIAETLNCDLPAARMHRLSLGPAPKAVAACAAEAPDGMPVFQAALAKARVQDGSRGAGARTAASERRRGQLPPTLEPELVPAAGPRTAAKVDMSELLDTICDELSMSLRYHQGLFPSRPIDRVIFLGGEARQTWLCQHILKELRLGGQLGNPLVRLQRHAGLQTPGLDPDELQPGWAVPYGLCMAPTDL